MRMWHDLGSRAASSDRNNHTLSLVLSFQLRLSPKQISKMNSSSPSVLAAIYISCNIFSASSVGREERKKLGEDGGVSWSRLYESYPQRATLLRYLIILRRVCSPRKEPIGLTSFRDDPNAEIIVGPVFV